MFRILREYTDHDIHVIEYTTDGVSVSHRIESSVAEPVKPATPVELLEAAKTAKVAQLKLKCDEEILTPFVSDALGQNHRYAFGVNDQQNFTQATLMFILDPTRASINWKTEDAGELVHTKAQFMGLLSDAEAHKWANISRYRALKLNAENAESVEEVNSIKW